MKLSKSKLALAKVINENGGWADDSVYAANDEGGIICGYLSKPIRRNTTPYHWSGSQRETWIRGIKTPQWHQCVLSREEYYHAHPKADADGWIEWKGGECPVDGESIVDVELNSGNIVSGVAKGLSWRHEWKYSNVIAYRLHKPDVKPEFCESVMRSIPEPESKPTIEQLAADYRNAKDYAERKQQEADDAKVDADSKLKALELAGEAIGLTVSPITERQSLELVITDWRQWRVGDVVSWSLLNHAGEFEIISVHHDQSRNIGDFEVKDKQGGVYRVYGNECRFIRRP